MPIIEIVFNGDQFDTLEEFYVHIDNVMTPPSWWGKNLDAFNDILRGGFEGQQNFDMIRWVNSDRSKLMLGHAETRRQLKLRLKKCHPSNRKDVEEKILVAQTNSGPTVFDWIETIIRDQKIRLELE